MTRAGQALGSRLQGTALQRPHSCTSPPSISPVCSGQHPLWGNQAACKGGKRAPAGVGWPERQPSTSQSRCGSCALCSCAQTVRAIAALTSATVAAITGPQTRGVVVPVGVCILAADDGGVCATDLKGRPSQQEQGGPQDAGEAHLRGCGWVGAGRDGDGGRAHTSLAAGCRQQGRLQELR